MTTKYRVRSAHGRVHILTAERAYKLHGTPRTNRPGSVCGRADCGALTSSAATLTSEPANCAPCVARQR